jgi:hypothetical protein
MNRKVSVTKDRRGRHSSRYPPWNLGRIN